MDTNRLKQFCVIAECGSLTRAAELLHITHSGLSKSMRLFQEEIGIILLRPAGRGLALTDDGLMIYKRAKDFLENEQRLFKIEKNQNHSMLRIGSVEIFLCALSRKLMEIPFVNKPVSLLDLDPGLIEQLIINKELDFGITYVPYPTKNLEIIQIGRFGLGCYHLQNRFEQVDIKDIPFVAPAKSLLSNPAGIKERDGWFDSIYPRNKKYTVNLLSTAIELTLQGLCAIYMPDFVARIINSSRKEESILVEYPISKKRKHFQTAYLLMHKDQDDIVLYKQLCKLVKNCILTT